MAKDDVDEQSEAPVNISRRGFLKGAGIGAAVPTLLGSATEALAAARGPAVMGPGAVPVTLKVNGVEKKLQLEPHVTLAQALRDELGLTGTKVVCDRGACSACTVYLDGLPVNSCLTFALDVGKREVTTIEGLAKGNKLHPVQEAFIAEDAMQCGFCTPGMVMSCAHLLAHNPKPTVDDVKEAVSGNLCRCGTYPKVFAATIAASRGGKKKEG